MERKVILRIVVCALLTAMGVILGGALSIPAVAFGTYSVKIGFGVLPVILSAVLYGPLYGGMVGGLTDLLQALIFPKGAFEPWFTLIGILFGLIPGLFFRKKQNPTKLRLFLAIACGQLIGSVLCNTCLMVYLYGLPWALMIARFVNQAVMIPLYTLLVGMIMRVLERSRILERIR